MLKYSHVDIVVQDLRAFLAKWCPCLGLYHSRVQTWGSAKENTWAEFAFVFDGNGALVFMAVEGKKGAHVKILLRRGSGSIYRMCFKSEDISQEYGHLQEHGVRIVDVDGADMTLRRALDSNKILWLEKDGELSIEILTASRINSAAERLWREILTDSATRAAQTNLSANLAMSTTRVALPSKGSPSKPNHHASVTTTAIVVLGQSLNPDGTAPATLTSRIRTAAEQWHADPSAILICTGGDPAGVGSSEAEIMFDMLVKEYGAPGT